jgi:hypothetical protein
MFRKMLHVASFSGLALLCWSCGPASEAPEELLLNTARPALEVQEPLNRVLVRFRPGALGAEGETLHRWGSSRLIKRLAALELDVVELPNADEALAALNRYRASPLVEFAELDRWVEPMLSFDDPMLRTAWHLDKIENGLAWDRSTGKGVLVAVCDSGVRASHEDLARNLRMDLAWNVVDNNSNVADIKGHGTMVAGTIAAVGNNGLGSAGVAPGASIMPVRISTNTQGSATYADMADCMHYAADRRARVINISYGGVESATINAAAAYAESKGALVVFSAGNDGVEKPTFPDWLAIIVVGASTSTDTRASFSSWGRYVDLAAPGVSVPSTSNDGRYVYWNGTSAAAPVVAGVAALVRSARPDLTVGAVKQVLARTADPIGAAILFGEGRVNARRAVLQVTATGNVQINQGVAATRSPVTTLALTAEIPVVAMRLSTDGKIWTTWVPYTQTRTHSLPPTDGIHTLHVQFMDALGLMLPVVTDSIVLDTQAPVLSCPAPILAWAPSDAGTTVSFSGATATDAAPVTLEYSHATGAVFPLGVTTVQVSGADPAGNQGKCSFEVRIDRVPDPVGTAVSSVVGCSSSATGPQPFALLAALLAGLAPLGRIRSRWITRRTR